MSFLNFPHDLLNYKLILATIIGFFIFFVCFRKKATPTLVPIPVVTATATTTKTPIITSTTITTTSTNQCKQSIKQQQQQQQQQQEQTSFIKKAEGFSWVYGGEQKFFVVKIGQQKLAQKYYQMNKEGLLSKAALENKIIIGKTTMCNKTSELLEKANNNNNNNDNDDDNIDINDIKQCALSRWEIFLLYIKCGLHQFGQIFPSLQPSCFSYSITAPEKSDGSDIEWRIIHSGKSLRQEMVSKHFMLAKGKPIILSGEMFIYFNSECINKIKLLIKNKNNSNSNSNDIKINDIYNDIIPYCKVILDNSSGTYSPKNDHNRYYHVQQLLKYSFLNENDHNYDNDNDIQNKINKIPLEIHDKNSKILKQYKKEMKHNLNASV